VQRERKVQRLTAAADAIPFLFQLGPEEILRAQGYLIGRGSLVMGEILFVGIIARHAAKQA
jgi:hypothetical protein